MKPIRCAFLCGLPCLARAFGPKYEPLKGGRGNTFGRMSRSNNESNEERKRPGVQRRGFSLHYENRIFEINGEILQGRVFISEPFVLDAFSFGIANPFEVPDTRMGRGDADGCGEECDECSIPEEYKQVDPVIDVLAYLGIRRADSLRAPGVNDNVGDWA